jgi:glycosyltransferase involved in cell wall biosynthesis
VRVLIVTPNFRPEAGATGARLSGLAGTWAADGDDVTVLTGMPGHRTGGLTRAGRRAVLGREFADGYRVIRTWRSARPDEGIARTALGQLGFMASSVLVGGRASGPADAVVLSAPTCCSILSGWLLARRKRATFVLDIRDPWPAIPVEPGGLAGRAVTGMLRHLELAAYAAADQVVVVGEGFRADLIRRGVPPEKVHAIGNGVDVGRFPPEAGAARQRDEVRARLGAGPADCLVLSAGMSRALATVADAAALLDRPAKAGPAGVGPAGRAASRPAIPGGSILGGAIRFAFAGDGAGRRHLERLVAERGLGNVVLLPAAANAELPALLAAADVCLVPLPRAPRFATVVPAEMSEYLAAGKAVIGSAAGDAAQILAEAGAVVVPPEDSGSLAAAIAALAADPPLRQALGRAGRAFAQRRYDRAALAREYRKILDLDVQRASRG